MLIRDIIFSTDWTGLFPMAVTAANTNPLAPSDKVLITSLISALPWFFIY